MPPGTRIITGMAYYVYIVRCEDDSLYTGITTDVVRRMVEHRLQAAPGARYTRSRKVADLVALWRAPDRAQASVLEYRVKRLRRAGKLRLIAQPDGADAVAFPQTVEMRDDGDADMVKDAGAVFEPVAERERASLWAQVLEACDAAVASAGAKTKEE